MGSQEQSYVSVCTALAGAEPAQLSSHQVRQSVCGTRVRLRNRRSMHKDANIRLISSQQLIRPAAQGTHEARRTLLAVGVSQCLKMMERQSAGSRGTPLDEERRRRVAITATHLEWIG